MPYYFSGQVKAGLIKTIVDAGGRLMLNAIQTEMRKGTNHHKELSSVPGNLMVLDSGAYQGNEDIDGYCTFLKNTSLRFRWYANLDVINNPQETEKNYRIMTERGLNPLWVHQPGGSLDALKRHAEDSVVGVGGLVPMGPENALRHLLIIGRIVSSVGGKVHAFGVNNKYTLTRIAQEEWFQSADGSSVVVNSIRARKLLNEKGQWFKMSDAGLMLTQEECLANNIRVVNSWLNGDSSSNNITQLGLFNV
jgi:hypothetical protein